MKVFVESVVRGKGVCIHTHIYIYICMYLLLLQVNNS